MPHHDHPANNAWGTQQHDEAQDDPRHPDAEGWGPWDEAVAAQNANPEQPAVEPPQDQNSMVLNPSLGSNSSSDEQPNEAEVEQNVNDEQI